MVKFIVCISQHYCSTVLWSNKWPDYLWEVAAETGRPAALGAGAHATNVLLAQDLVTALRVGTPGQVGAALHEPSQKGTVILQEKAQDTNSFSAPSTHGVCVLIGTYFGNGVLIGKDVVKELGGGLSAAVCDRTVAVHNQILFDTSSEVLLPAGLRGNRNSMTKSTKFNITSHKRLTSKP